jgi:ABC-type molybdate transport system ATPase subunit
MKNNFTIGHHEAFRREMLAGVCHERDFDEIDELAAADPLLDRLPAYRSGSELDRLNQILDELERGNG